MKTQDRNLLKEDGFTLIEVLMAVVIMGLALPLIIEGLSIALDATSRALEETLAAILARERMASASLFLEEGEGDIEKMGRTFYWEVKKSTSIKEGLYEISVVITWQGRRNARKYEITSLYKEELL